MKLADYNKEDLKQLQEELNAKYGEYKARNLKLNMSRGKPGSDQLELSLPMLEPLADYRSEDGTDALNYGQLTGVIEAKRLFAEIMEVDPANVIVGGNSSLNLMYDEIGRAFSFGLSDCAPWSTQGEIKFLCPAPGYDRHFTICETFGIKMIPIAMNADGPDMDEIERLVASDASIKGMWCVPMYSNPDGITYSDQVVARMGALKPAAKDFRVFCDNAYCVHHLDMNDMDTLANIYDAFAKCGNEDLIYIFASTSKVTFPHGGISAIAASPANIARIAKYLNAQIISYDKINQLRHARYLKDKAGVLAHMAKHAAIMKPKFDIVFEGLRNELAPLEIATWQEPKGGYFISVFLPEGCAKRTVQLCKECGVELTGAGAPYPYKNDPADSNIRIAPTFPPVAELKLAMEVFCISAKLACVEKYSK